VIFPGASASQHRLDDDDGHEPEHDQGDQDGAEASFAHAGPATLAWR
jgi:hypothetical protein